MLSPSRVVAFVCGTAVVACLLACGAPQKMREAAERQKRRNDLLMVGLTYHNYHDANGKLPPDQQALLQWAQKSAPEVVSIVQSGQYTFLYAPVRIPEITEGASNTVIGYENQPLSGGRLVLMADASVIQM